MKEIYKDIVADEIKLAKIISDMEKEITYDTKSGIVGHAIAEEFTEYIKITVMKVPGKVSLFKNVGTKYYKETRDFWLGVIRYALDSAGIYKTFDKCIVVIKICFSTKYSEIWDVDNHHIQFIINALRYCGIVPDDSWNFIRYMVMGEESNDNKTEVYVAKHDDFIKLLAGKKI